MSDDQFGDDAPDAPVVLKVVCTDRGQHASARVSTVTREEWGYLTIDLQRRSGVRPVFDEDGEEVDSSYRASYSAPEPEPHMLKYSGPGTSTTSHRFRCHRCRRHLTIQGERWQDMVERLVSAGVSHVDISVLDRLGC